MGFSNKDWSHAIALRITDELSVKSEFPEDSAMLCDILEKLFLDNSWAVEKIIGTGIIEANYFKPLD